MSAMHGTTHPKSMAGPTGMSREQWSDMNWGAEHHAAVYTEHHLMAKGRTRSSWAEQGCKLWTAYSPARPYTRREVQEYYNGTLELCVNDLSSSEEEVEGEGRQRLDYAVGYTLLMLPETASKFLSVETD